jgi:hypothetical protein
MCQKQSGRCVSQLGKRSRMDIILTGEERIRFRESLRAVRSRSSLNDAEYARDVLRVSLNTFKKCLAEAPDLRLKQRSFNNIVSNIGLDRNTFDSNRLPLPPPMTYGGYTKSEFSYLIGRYLLFRRSFQNGVDISKAVLDISWSDSLSCLVFNEMRRYKTDGNVWQSNDIKGTIYMHAERVLMGLLAIDGGDVRLTLLHIPSRNVYGTQMGTIRTSGAVLTHGYPKRYFQPVVSAVTLEAIGPTLKRLAPNDICGILTKDDPEYAAAEEELRIAEDHAAVMTPLMARAAGN